MAWTYVTNLFDPEYSTPPSKAANLPAEALPPQEFELREMLAVWMGAFIPWWSRSWLDRVFFRGDYRRLEANLSQANIALKAALEDPAYLAALERVVSAMPDHARQKRYLGVRFLGWK